MITPIVAQTATAMTAPVLRLNLFPAREVFVLSTALSTTVVTTVVLPFHKVDVYTCVDVMVDQTLFVMELEMSMDGCDVYVDDCVSPDDDFELLEEVESDSGEDGKMDEEGVVINEDVKVDDEDVKLVMSVTVTETEVVMDVKGMDGLGGVVNVGRSEMEVVNGGVVGEVMVGNDTGIDVAEERGGMARDVDRDLGSGEFDIVVVVVPVVGDGVEVGFGLVTPFAGVVGFAGADDVNGNVAVVVIEVTVVAVGVKVGGVEVTALPGVKIDDDTSDVGDPVSDPRVGED